MSVIVVKVDCSAEPPKIIFYPEEEEVSVRQLTSTGRQEVYHSCKNIITKCRRLMRICERLEAREQSGG